MSPLTIVWLLSSALALIYLAALELLMRRLESVAPTKFAELGSPSILPWKVQSGVCRSTPTRRTGLIWFLIRRGYRATGDRRLSMHGHAALACLVLSIASMIGLVAASLIPDGEVSVGGRLMIWLVTAIVLSGAVVLENRRQARRKRSRP